MRTPVHQAVEKMIDRWAVDLHTHVGGSHFFLILYLVSAIDSAATAPLLSTPPASSAKAAGLLLLQRPPSIRDSGWGLGFRVGALGELRASPGLEKGGEASRPDGGGGRRGGKAGSGGAAGRAVVEGGWARSGRGQRPDWLGRAGQQVEGRRWANGTTAR